MKAFKEPTLLAGLALVIATTMAFGKINNSRMIKSIQKGDKEKGSVVVELYTSEGCSSCPPADQLLEKLQTGNHNQQLYIMAFHVDYWDHQGWRDRFSQSKFSNRQKQYAYWLHLNTIYTPQLIINGKTEMVGSDESKVLGSLQAALDTTPSRPLSLNTKAGGGELKVSYSGAAVQEDAWIVAALVQKNAHSNVSAGENEGRKLSHVQIVREMQQQELEAQGEISLKLPEDFDKKGWEVIVFVQNKANGHISQASKTEP